VEALVRREALSNVTPVLVHGYNCPLPDSVADVILVLSS
jgi:hypothetical protein